MGNSSGHLPVTPRSGSSAAIAVLPCLDGRQGRLSPRAAVLGRRGGEPGADLTMKGQLGGTQKRARFQALCQALRPDLLRFAFWLARDRALAEDVVQESMLRAWKAQDSLLDESAAKPWLLDLIRPQYAPPFAR